MIVVQLNGESQQFSESKTVQEVLNQFKIQSTQIAVAVNAEIVPHSQLNAVKIADGDRIEIVQARGGG